MWPSSSTCSVGFLVGWQIATSLRSDLAIYARNGDDLSHLVHHGATGAFNICRFVTPNDSMKPRLWLRLDPRVIPMITPSPNHSTVSTRLN
jgi:hypothetical protein